MKRKLVFILVAGLLLFPWTVAYAYDDAAASTGTVEITPADTSSLPHFNVCGNAIGSVTPGDLFIIDITGSDTDTFFSLYLTNADELIHNFRYMTLNIGTYIQTATGEWEKASSSENVPDIILTMQNGIVSFALGGGARYKITIDKGCFNCYAIGAVKTIVLPDFYLTTS
jgi:hypothetical protein